MFRQYLNSDYDIYDDGRCYSHKSEKFLTPQMTNKYPTYNLTIDNKKKKHYVHKMVAETFISNPENKPIVNHKDGNTHNFNVENLEWVTASENSQHAVDIGLKSSAIQVALKYEPIIGEEWRSILDYSNYAASNFGRIMNVKTKRLLRQPKNYKGYKEVSLWKNNKGTTLQSHVIIYKAFNPMEDLSGFVINHKDGDKMNNSLSNLEKITYQENNLHAEYEIKTHNCSKAVAAKNIETGEIIATFRSISEAQKKLNISNISRAIKNNTTSGGYKWSFI